MDSDRRAPSASQVGNPWANSHINTGAPTPVQPDGQTRKDDRGASGSGGWDDASGNDANGNDANGNDQPNVDNAPGNAAGPAGQRGNGGLGGLGGLGSVIFGSGGYGGGRGNSGNESGDATGNDAGRGNRSRGEGSGGGQPGTPGKFDYYLLTLSWAPEFCHGHANSPECDGSHPGFVVHGLWPQNADGSWPQSCSSAPEPDDAKAMLDIMPDPRLISHEWEKHGTCSGLSGQQYFDTVRSAYRSIRIPQQLQGQQTDRVSAAQIKQAFSAANPGLPQSAIAVSCHNRYFAGAEFCLDKNLHPEACQAVRDCTQDSITIASGH